MISKKRKICNLFLILGYYLLFILIFEKINSIKLLSSLSIYFLLLIPMLGMSNRKNRSVLYKNLDTIIVVIILFVSFLLIGLFVNLEDFTLINNFILYCVIFSSGIFPILLNMKDIYTFKNNRSNNFIYNFFVLFLILYMLIMYIFNLLNISSNYLLTFFFLIQIFSFAVSIFLFCIKNKKNLNLNIKRIKQYKINLGHINNNLYFYIINVFNFYCSILLVYYILIDKYYYSVEQVSFLYKECYINSLAIIIFVSYIVYYIFIKNNNKNIERQILNLFKICLPISIFISILSNPIFFLIFNSKNSYFLMFMIWFVLIISIYILLIKYAISKIGIQLTNKVISVGIFFKIIIVYPLINSVYRMGYNLMYGDILTNMLSYILVIIFLLIILRKKKLISFSKYFDNLLKIIYNNIVYSLILILITLFVSVNVKVRLYSIFVILFYLIISIAFLCLKKILEGGINAKEN